MVLLAVSIIIAGIIIGSGLSARAGSENIYPEFNNIESRSNDSCNYYYRTDCFNIQVKALIVNGSA
jgi:hypothetical protein